MIETPHEALLKAARDCLAAGRREDRAEVHGEWENLLVRIARHVVADDLGRFTTWPAITDTMFIGDYADTPRQLAALRRLPDWESRWAPALVESPVGGAAPSALWPPSSGNQIRQAYVLARFEAAMGAPIDTFDRIIEFGGGFGAHGLLAHRLGFRGRYVLVDNQPVRALQRWYLQEHGLGLAPDGEVPSSPGIATIAAEALLDTLRQEGAGRTAVIANWSLSEAPPAFRDAVFDALRRAEVDAIWVTYQRFFGTDNARDFCSRIADFAGVYDASVAAFQDDAATDDYYYGHGCLALRRVPGRRFPASTLALEQAPFEARTMPWLLMEDLHGRMREAILRGTAFSAVRLGDGEARIMGYPRFVPRPLVADIWQTWFGHAEFDEAEVAQVREALREACLGADAVGVPIAEADIESEFGRVKALLPREGFARPTTTLCHAGFHLGFHRQGRYATLLAGLPRIGVIGPRDLTEVLPRLYGVPEVVWLPTPPEMKYSDLPEPQKAYAIRNRSHLGVRYGALTGREIPALLRRYPGMVVLVGAGILGKAYCQRVKACGGIGIDVGSMMDVWAGLRTRENQRFDGLRPVLA